MRSTKIRVHGWGRIVASVSNVVEAATVEDIRDALRSAAATNRTVIARGAGYSYGDPALNRDGVILDITAMNRVLRWDAEAGVVDVEPGATIGDLGHFVEADGWWPTVVPGTQAPTIGGCLAANVHGKNNWRDGPIGEHVEELDILLADGSLRTLTPTGDRELFHAVAGGFGLLGVITRARLRMARSSGVLRVDHSAGAGLEDLMATLDRWSSRADYMVGWVDGFATGKTLGRGLIQIAHALDGGDAPESQTNHRPHQSIDGSGGVARDSRQAGGTAAVSTLGNEPTHQVTRATVSSLQLQARHSRPSAHSSHLRSHFWPALMPVANSAAFRRLNAIQYLWGSLHNGSTSVVSRRRFDFFHDLVPNWNRAFLGGIVQYQMFVPRENALRVFSIALERTQAAGFPPFLAVLKLHRQDAFLLSEGVEGFSLSLDMHAGRRREELPTLLRTLTDEVVVPVGGRFYLAKDTVLTTGQARASFGTDAFDSFLRLKREVDPAGLFDSDLSRRVFGIDRARLVDSRA